MTAKLWLGIKDRRDAKKDKHVANRERNNMLSQVNSWDHDPVYASDLAPQWQGTQSPIHKGFIDSLVMGTNPSNVSPGRADRGRIMQDRQRQETSMFGSPEERVKLQRQLATGDQWATRSPRDVLKERRANVAALEQAGNAPYELPAHRQKEAAIRDAKFGGSPVSHQDAFTAQNAGLAQAGINEDQLNRLYDEGIAIGVSREKFMKVMNSTAGNGRPGWRRGGNADNHAATRNYISKRLPQIIDLMESGQTDEARNLWEKTMVGASQAG
jgi:hypothetical protein